MGSMKNVDLVGHIKFLPSNNLMFVGCSVTRPFFSLQRVWLARPELVMISMHLPLTLLNVTGM